MLPPGISNLGGLAAKFGPLAIGITAAVFAFKKLAAVIGEAIDIAGKFEYKMAEVSTLLTKNQMKIMPKLSKEVMNLSYRFGSSADMMSKAMYQTISAGVDAKKAGAFLKMAGKLSVGGVTDMETAVDGLTSIKNAYGFAMKDMTKVSDTLFTGMRLGKALDLDIDIPTPDRGFVKLRDIKAGDKIFNENGKVEIVL